MNSGPTRKSIFAPVTHSKFSSLPPIDSSGGFTSDDKSIETPSPSYPVSPSFCSHSSDYFGQEPQTAVPPRKGSIKKAANASNRPKGVNPGRNSLGAMHTQPPAQVYKKSMTSNPKSLFFAEHHQHLHHFKQPTQEKIMQTPSLFKEYKYRPSVAGDALIKEGPNNESRQIKRISTYSSNKSSFIDSKPMDTSISKLQRNHPAVRSSDSATPITLFRSSFNTNSYINHMGDEHLLTTLNSEMSDEDTLSTARKRLRKVKKRTFYAMYFIGVMLSFRNKVIVYGALRPLEYLEEFESFQPPKKKEYILPILPSSPFGLVWGIVLIIFLMITAALTPVYISFFEDNDPFFYNLNLVIDVFFGLDIIVNFISAYYDSKDELVTNFFKIALNYLRMWFWIDVLSVIPLSDIIDWFTSNQNSFDQANKIIKFLRFPRLYKLVKIVRLLKLAKMFSKNQSFNQIMKKLDLNTHITKLLRIFLSFAFLNHLVGCIWFYLARLDDFSPDTWVGRADLVDVDVKVQYIAAVYWSFQTLTTVGYGDIAPQTSLERSVATIWTVIGVLIYTFTIGNLSTILFSFGKRTECLKEKLTSFEIFAIKTGLPDFLTQKVRRFYEYLNFLYVPVVNLVRINHKENARYSIDPKSMLKSLPANLKTSLLLFSYYNLIKNINMLQINANLTAALLLQIKVLRLSPGEIIYRQDDPAEEIFFISKGTVKFLTQNGKGIYTLSEGTYFGELEVFEGNNRHCFCQAIHSTLLLICPKEPFLEIMEDFPDIQAQMEKMMKSRKLKMDEKLERIQRINAVTRSENNLRQIYLCKKTEYINKVLLKIPDIKVRFEMRRKRERSMLVRPKPNPNLKAKEVKAKSLGSLKLKGEPETPLKARKFQKSMQDVAMTSTPDGSELFLTSKPKEMTFVEDIKKDAAKLDKLVRLPTLNKNNQTPNDDSNQNKSAELANQSTSPLGKGLNMSDLGENASFFRRKSKEMIGSLLSESKDDKFGSDSADPVDFGSWSSLSISKRKRSSSKHENERSPLRRMKSSVDSVREVKLKPHRASFVRKSLLIANRLFSSIKRKSFRDFLKISARVAPANHNDDERD